MSPQVQTMTYVPLRTVTDLLSNTPTTQLPNVVQHLVTALQSSRSLLSSPEASKSSKDGTTESVTLHKYRTQISTLLLGKSREGRWVAVVLIKTTIESGGWEILQSSGTWVRGMLEILRKPNPPETLSICILTLTRIFLLTRPYPTLVREITTPAVTTFIKTCINLISPIESGPKLDVTHSCLDEILNAFYHLLPNHPNLFRSFPQLHDMLILLVAPTPSTITSHDNEEGGLTHQTQLISVETRLLAQSLLVTLHHSAPKNTSAVLWATTLTAVIQNLHATADQVFRAVYEEWESTSGRPNQPPDDRSLAETVTGVGVGSIMAALPRWIGIRAGLERLEGLLHLLEKFISLPTASPVSLPLGAVVDTLTRFLFLTVPSTRQGNARLNPQIDRAERDGLWLGLPQIHVATLEIVSALVTRLQQNCVPIARGFLGQISWVFQAEDSDFSLRYQTYSTLSVILPHVASSLSKSTVSSLDKIIKSCCSDLLTPALTTTSQPNPTLNPPPKKSAQKNGTTITSANADTFTSTSALAIATSTPPKIQSAASTLLPQLISLLPARHVKSALRAQLDRTAILTQHKEAMLAAVLNVPHRGTGDGKVVESIMPHLARASGRALEVEGLLRPRLPVIRTGVEAATDSDPLAGQVDEEEEHEDGMDVDDSTMIDMYRRSYTSALNDGGMRKRAHELHSAEENLDLTGSMETVATKRSKHAHETLASDTIVAISSTTVQTVPRLPDDGLADLAFTGPSQHESISLAVSGDPDSAESIPATKTSTVLDATSTTIQKTHAEIDDSPKNEDSSADDDDDDFEIPTLIMDPDTDDESGNGGEEAEEESGRG